MSEPSKDHWTPSGARMEHSQSENRKEREKQKSRNFFHAGMIMNEKALYVRVIHITISHLKEKYIPI